MRPLLALAALALAAALARLRRGARRRRVAGGGATCVALFQQFDMPCRHRIRQPAAATTNRSAPPPVEAQAQRLRNAGCITLTARPRRHGGGRAAPPVADGGAGDRADLAACRRRHQHGGRRPRPRLLRGARRPRPQRRQRAARPADLPRAVRDPGRARRRARPGAPRRLRLRPIRRASDARAAHPRCSRPLAAGLAPAAPRAAATRRSACRLFEAYDIARLALSRQPASTERPAAHAARP